MAKKHIGKADQLLILDLAYEGKTMAEISKTIDISVKDFTHFLDQNIHFKKKYATARDIGMDILAEELITMAMDETKDIQRLRLQSDNTRWYLSKKKAEVYGDRVDVNINKTVDISGALEQARSRLKDVTPHEEEPLSIIDVKKLPDIFD